MYKFVIWLLNNNSTSLLCSAEIVKMRFLLQVLLIRELIDLDRPDEIDAINLGF